MTQGASVLDPRAAGGKRLQGKFAIVTGSGQGHGRATARRFVEEGAAVMIVDRHQPGAERVRDELRAYGGRAEMIIADIGNPEAAKELMAAAKEQFGRIDILVNNVGGAFRLPDSGEMGWEKTPEDLIGNIQNNLFTCLWCCWAVAPIMIEQQAGSIVNFGSHAVRGMGRLGYAAAKGGVWAITTSLALELAPHNVRINLVVPHASTRSEGDVLVTRIPGEVPASSGRTNVSVTGPTLTPIPLNRPGTPEEIAAAVTFLASDDSSFTTAETICVGGGAFCRL